MSSRLEAHLRARLAEGRKLLIPFLTARDPDEARFLAAARAAVEAGADALEIGVPFSDPLADGPTIQRASQRSLELGTTLTGILDLVRREGDRFGVPIVLMTYMNPIHAIGIERFAEQAAAAGVSGVLISDLPPEEMPEVGAVLRARGCDRITLIAPTTLPDRVDLLLRGASGFIYLVTRTGVTGAGAGFSDRLAEQVVRIRAGSSLPIIAGFGIRSADDVGLLSGLVDGVVIGARLVEILESTGTPDEVPGAVGAFLEPIRRRLDRA